MKEEKEKKRTDNGAGPSALAVISLRKVDSLLVFLNVMSTQKGSG
jgi:hypothetical protein